MLVLIRHGESTLNAEGRLVGRLDPALTERGERQAQAAGSLLGSVAEVKASPLLRTRQTADLLGIDAPMHVDDRVIELDYGDLDGAKLTDVDPGLWGRWYEDATFTPDGGESLADLGARMRAVLEELFEVPGEGARAKDGDVVIVSHVSPIKAAVAWALDVDDLVAWRLRLSNGSITRIDFGPRGPQLLGFNEIPSLAFDATR